MTTLKIALRNLLLHRVKTAIIGFIIVFGTALAIVGNSVVDAISSGMEKSLTDSVTGHIQIFSSSAKEKLSIFGNMDGSMPDVKHVNDFGHVRDVLMRRIPNIRAMIPMGTNFAMWSPGNILDVKLEELRALYGAHPRDSVRINSLKLHVKSIVQDIQQKLQESRQAVGQVLAKDENFAKAPENLKRALAPEFWSTFDQNADSRIEFLGNTMAPLIFDDSFVWLSYMGTVPGAFQKAFSQFEVVKGQAIPEGRRGFLFSDYVYETIIKNRVARRLDQIKKRIDKDGASLSNNKLQQDTLSACVAQASEVYTQVSPADTEVLVKVLQKYLSNTERDLAELVRSFLKGITDQNFADRYRFFYSEIAPRIVLYKVKIGDVFPVTAFSDSGYSTSVNMKVYGTYRFRSFESSPIAGNFNLMDMMSFRELYGFMTAEKREETRSLEAEMGVRDLGRDDVESLFGGGVSAGQELKPKPSVAIHKAVGGGFGRLEQRRKVFERTYSTADMENGVFLNAAIVLHDPTRLAASLKEIERVSATEKLGIQAIHWREAAGITGQLTILVRAVLYFLVAITFAIATFVIMNSMLMATLERTREIGTMRAIGAQRGFLLKLFLGEAAILSFIFGSVGVLIGAAVIQTVGARGIPAMGDPAQGDVTTFFFSGDRLFLTLNPVHIGIVFICMTLVAILSTQYPAWRAMRISPLEAIQSKE